MSMARIYPGNDTRYRVYVRLSLEDLERAGRRKFIYKANAVSEDSEDSLSRRDRAMP
jgi:hypothetical protein